MADELPKVVSVEVKPKMQSWTLWLNGAGTLLIAVAGFMGQLPEVAPYAAIVLSVGNFLLRFKTNSPISGGVGS